ncbi:Type III restriction enzyme, res subunit [compost metagenome]
MTFRNLTFPPAFKYSSDSDHIPLEFYEETFPVAKEIDLLLGYFSSNAIKVISQSFAEFIFHGGRMRIITNHILSLKDKENLIDVLKLDKEDQVIDIFSDLEQLARELSDYGIHFFDCLKYLRKQGRLEIIPVKFNGVDLAHCKKMILFDGHDYISTDGSINFTLSALTRNSESFEVNAPWKGEIFQYRTEEERKNFNKIFSKQHSDYQYLSPDQIEIVIDKIGSDKNIQDLLDDSIKLDKSSFGEKVNKILNTKKERFKLTVEELKTQPHFPENNKPREYQTQAYKNWVGNNFTGIFGMATGTGKTKTSLNCVLNEYQKTKNYFVIILVPSIALLNQWSDEVNDFNFQNQLLVGGGNNWEGTLSNYTSNFKAGLKKNLVIISTYASFSTTKFQKYFSQIEEDFILIADEAHNMGANSIKRSLVNSKIKRRIGLSATPKRVYDVEGTAFIDDFFNDKEPYTFSFSMKEAMEKEYLTNYKYYPVLVELNDLELEKYIDISKKLLRYFDFKKGEFKKDPMVEKLLLIRKNIIHKAQNKIQCFKAILNELKSIQKLKYIFTYIPEGYVINNETQESERMLNQFLIAGKETLPNLRMNSYLADGENLEDLLRGFTEGRIDMLFAMKMLDEGVDVPRAEIGIFASSTGNPRQFIQRRGRLLRLHKEKPIATIYDMVVVPRINDNNEELFTMERNLVHNELRRVGYFASLSLNFYDSRDALEVVCGKYNLDLDTIINEL